MSQFEDTESKKQSLRLLRRPFRSLQILVRYMKLEKFQRTNMKPRQQKRVLLEAIALLALIASIFLGEKPYVLELENILWDLRLRWIADQSKPDSRVAIITIDQGSLNYMAQVQGIYWPWPRSIYAELTQQLADAEAHSIIFDIIFSEPSVYGVEDDKTFGESIIGKNVVFASSLRRASSATPQDRAILSRSIIKDRASAPFFQRHSQALGFNSILLPSASIADSAVIGDVTGAPDLDGTFRSSRIATLVGDVVVPTLPFAAIASTGDLSELSLASLPTTREKELEIRFYGPPRTIPTYGMATTLSDLASSDLAIRDQARAQFRGRYVFIGMDAPGLMDLRPTPLSPLFPGTELQATVASNLLRGEFISKVPSLLQTLVNMIVAWCAGAIFLRNISLIRQVATALLFTLFICCTSLLLATYGYWLALALPLALLATSSFLSLAYQYTREGREHRFIRDAFKLYVTPELIDRMVNDPSTLKIGGDRRELTMFFSDIEGFTSISEQMDPQDLARLINKFLSAMSSVILKHGGTVDKYVGDAIVAFWNAPIVASDHASLAVSAAIDCQRALRELNQEIEAEYKLTLRMRIGIHTGTVSVGNFGSNDRFSYTILGDNANLASRLEGANKAFGTYILISEDTVRNLSGFTNIRRLGRIRVVGKESPISIFEPIAPDSFMAVNNNKEIFADALAKFDLGLLEEALTQFRTLIDDAASQRYVERIVKTLKTISTSDSWDPVWNLSEK